jgi:hypothetical protein
VGFVLAATPAASAFASSKLPAAAAQHSAVSLLNTISPTASPTLGLCAQTPTGARNVLTSCDQPQAPHNETAIAINPVNPLNMIASANDYQEASPTSRTMLSRAHVSFDGGHSWADYTLPYPSTCIFTGDPSVAFDATGTAYISTLCEDNGSILITSSTNGGKSWAPQTVVASATPTSFNDHAALAAWGHGNVIVTWVPYAYTDSSQTQITTAPVAAAVSHDRGQHFGPASVISGSAAQCVGLTAPNACDQTWGNAVTVATNGAIYATFYNTSQYRPDGSTNLGRNSHFAVRLNPANGALIGSPSYIGLAYDGITTNDYPVNVDGRQTLHDSQLRILMQGNITADPTNPNHVAVVWFDDRNAPAPVSADPYAAVTNSDIVVSQSYNAGATWTAPSAIPRPGDQFFPWAAYDAFGKLRIGYFDRSYDPANHQYGYTLATETNPGSLHFSNSQVTTALSDPTRDNRWSTTSVNANFPNASRFIGDYSGIATIGDSVASIWTDQRIQSCLFNVCGHGEDTFAAVTRH